MQSGHSSEDESPRLVEGELCEPLWEMKLILTAPNGETYEGVSRWDGQKAARLQIPITKIVEFAAQQCWQKFLHRLHRMK